MMNEESGHLGYDSHISQQEHEPLLGDLPPLRGRTLYDRIRGIVPRKVDPYVLCQLEMLQGTPVKFLDVNRIPCQEISDASVREVEPTVSVVVPTYNHERFIAETLEGILCQDTDFPYEIVVGEDCSSDRTREIVFEYQKKYPNLFRILISKRNLYQTGSSNSRRSILASRGRYIAFCEGDDYWIDHKKLQKQVDIFHSNPSIDVIYTDAYWLTQENGRLDYCSIGEKNGIFHSPESVYNILTKTKYRQWLTCSSIFQRSVFERRQKEDGFANVNLEIGDFPLWVNCVLNGGVYYLKEPTCVYRHWSQSITHSSKTNALCHRASLVACLFYLAQDAHVPVFDKRNANQIGKIVYYNSVIAAGNKANCLTRLFARCSSLKMFMLNRSMPLGIRLRSLFFFHKAHLTDFLRKSVFLRTLWRNHRYGSRK